MIKFLVGASAMVLGFLIVEVAKEIHPQLGLLIFLVAFLGLAVWEAK
ncbi:hypothetical protein [Variovorax sp. 770b2]|nr:hypothetical protein [Variovorax sp. 770b2]SFP15151.1 hypothetical protein SAMN03159339_0589 [Variovorax sp. 770b2]